MDLEKKVPVSLTYPFPSTYECTPWDPDHWCTTRPKKFVPKLMEGMIGLKPWLYMYDYSIARLLNFSVGKMQERQSSMKKYPIDSNKTNICRLSLISAAHFSIFKMATSLLLH